MTGRHAERRSAIESALLDFQRTPGRHTVALRQPALLFASIREVLQYAGERRPDDEASPPPRDVVQAARFFVHAAMLKPGADHYTLLGLTREADATAIKERYRSMMRLTHPDFATTPGAATWPADAATRINQAYEALSSPERRRAYDEAAQPPASRPTPGEIVATRAPSAVPAQRRGDSRRILRHLAAGFGALAAIAVVALWAATASGERDSLVQRATTSVVTNKLSLLIGHADAQAESSTVAQTAPSLPPAADDSVLQAAVARALPVIVAASASTSSAPVTPMAEVVPAPPPLPAPAPAVAVAVAAAAPEAAATPVPPVMPATAPVATAPVAAATQVPAKPIPVAQAAPAPAPVRAAPVPADTGPSMADVHPIVTQLLQDIESGWGDNLIARLDFDARRGADAQALARQLDALCDGARPVKISKVALRGEPRDGRLVVVGQVILQVRDPSTPTRQFALQAEFAQQRGAPVLMRLAPVSSQ
jgi:DnaJ-domain-containing protein 1